MAYSVHPAAEIFPLMSEEEFSGLVADIQEHGLREPIVLYEGQVLDGRNRLRACEQLGIEARFQDWPNSEPPQAYVVSKNLHRRHLDEGQRAMIAARIASGGHGGNRRSEDFKSQICDLKISQGEAAEMLNTSGRTVSDANRVIEDGTPEEVASVEAGIASVSTTADKIRKRNSREGTSKKIMPEGHGARINVPDGTTAEGLCRKGMAMEVGGRSAEPVAKNLNISVNTYRMMRDIVALSDMDALSEQDVALVAQALVEMNSTKRVVRPHKIVKPIVKRVWGKGPRDVANSKNTMARRLEDFERPFGIIVESCACAERIDLPHLSAERATRALQEIRKAESDLRKFRAKLEGLYT